MKTRGSEVLPAFGLREMADQMFSRASGARLREGNRVRLLKDAAANYPAWREAIHAAISSIHVEMYIVHDDDQGRWFADALIEKARQGVRVRLLYDWLGSRKTSRAFWNRLRADGIEVRGYNPLRFGSPFAWASRDHRKMISVDGCTGFITGLCVGRAWVGDPARGLDGWRDTGIEVCGPAVADIEGAFADAWSAAGPALESAVGPPREPGECESSPAEAVHDVALRVVATVPNTGGLFRVDQLVAALARRTLWLTDAYFGGTTPYVQALQAAAQDGVDVRLLVPGGSDIPALRTLSRAGYRPLLESGVRIFEWNGPMLHAKTAVADGRWARVGSTNLNIASWIGNRELDAIVENETFAGQMETMYLDDLTHATEVVLSMRRRVREARVRPRQPRRVRGVGSGGRAVAGAIRLSSAVSAAVSNRRVLEPIEAHIALMGGFALGALALLAFWFPRGVAYPIAALAGWPALALVLRGVALLREGRRRQKESHRVVGGPPSSGRG